MGLVLGVSVVWCAGLPRGYGEMNFVCPRVQVG